MSQRFEIKVERGGIGWSYIIRDTDTREMIAMAGGYQTELNARMRAERAVAALAQKAADA